MTLDEFFQQQEQSRQLFEAVRLGLDGIGEVELRVSKSQIAFRRRRAFAWVWIPRQYLATKGNQRRELAPLVLTVALRHLDPSPRWKEIVEPAHGRFTHHLELYAVSDVDEQVRGWMREAWLLAT
jgi:hypothetical protein